MHSIREIIPSVNKYTEIVKHHDSIIQEDNSGQGLYFIKFPNVHAGPNLWARKSEMKVSNCPVDDQD